MICGGEVTLFIEPHLSPDALLIVGAGHISHHLAAMAKIAGFAVTVLDDREEFCNPRLFPDADRLLVGDIEQLLEQVEIGRQPISSSLPAGTVTTSWPLKNPPFPCRLFGYDRQCFKGKSHLRQFAGNGIGRENWTGCMLPSV